MNQGKGRNVEDLEVFKRAYRLSLDLHRISLEFPKIEQFAGLGDQLRRASKSVCGLIVEGGGRQAASSREFARYLTMAIGSAEEMKLWLRYSHDLGYVGQEQTEERRDEATQIIRMLNGLKSSLSDH